MSIERESYRDLEDLFRKHPEIKAALEGEEAVKRAREMTKYTGRTSAQINTIINAMDVRGGSSAKTKLQEVLGILNDAGIDVNVRTQKVGNNTMLQLVPVPYGDSNFYNRVGMEEQVWNLPISKDGTILFNNQERNDLLQAVSDQDGNIKLLGAAEVALNNILDEFKYEKNMEAIKLIKSTNNIDAIRGAKALRRILGTATRSAVDVGSAISQYNASALKDLESAMKLEGGKQRQDVIKSGVFLGNAYKGILDKYYAGQGTWAEQSLKKDQAARLINEMGLIISSAGVEKGYDIIRRNNKFKPILSDYRLAVPVLNAISQIAKLDLVYGPVSDTNGLVMGYLNDVPHLMNFLLPKHSRKGYQTTLTEQNYLNNQRTGAFTKGAKIITQREKALNVDKNSKAYDTTRFIQATQEELHKALMLRVSDLKAQKEGVDKALDPKTFNQLQAKLNRAEKELVLSIQNGGMLLDRERAAVLRSSHVVTKTLANEEIKARFDLLKKNNKQKASDSTLLRKAIRQTMNSQVSDLETYNPAEDIITFGPMSGPLERDKDAKKYLDQIKDFEKSFFDKDFDTKGSTVFSVMQGYNAKKKYHNNVKYVAPGTTIRATGLSTDIKDILPYLARVRGHKADYYDNKNIMGIIDQEELGSKNIVNSAVGAFWDAYGRAMEKEATPQQFLSKIRSKLSIPGLQSVFDRLFKLEGDTIVQQTGDMYAQDAMKKYFPAFMEAISTSFGGKSAFNYTRNGQKIKINPSQWYDIINEGKESDIDIEGSNEAFMAFMAAQHAGKHYGMPLSKGGMPVRYGYREFNSLMSLINLTDELSGTDMGDFREHYKDLSKKTDMSRQRYEGLMDFHKMAQELNGDMDLNESTLRAKNAVIIDIDEKTLEYVRQHPEVLTKGVYDKNVQSQSSKLPKFVELQKTLINDAAKLQEEQFKELEMTEEGKKQADALVAQAGGQEYIEQKIKDLRKTDTYKNLTDKELEARARIEAGSRFIPIALTAGRGTKDAMAFPNQNGTVSDYMVLPYFDYSLRHDAVGDVVDLGSTGPGVLRFIENFIGDLAKNGIGGANRKEIAAKAGERLGDLIKEEEDQLTLKDSATYDQATKVSMGHSFQGKVMDFATVNYNEIVKKFNKGKQLSEKDLQAYTKNAVVISRHMFNQLLTPQASEVEGWTDQLVSYYSELMGITGEEVRTQMDESLKDFTEKNKENPKFAKQLERSQQGWLRNKIADAITLGKGSDQTLSKGLVTLLNRYPSLLGDKDVLASKLLINPLWNKEKGSVVGGDEALIRLLNADFDGDTLVGALIGAGQLPKARAMQETVAKLTAFERLFDTGRSKKPGKVKLGDLFPSDEDQARDVILTKTGKAYVGMFSNVRQGFMNSVQGRSSSFNNAQDVKFSAAANLLGHFLSIFEQSSISAKKMSAADAIGFETQLSDLFKLVNDKETWSSGQNVKNVIAKAKKMGIFKESKDGSGLGLFGDDQSQARLGILPIAEMLLLSEQHQDDENYLDNLGKIFGLSGKDLKGLLPSLKMNEHQEFIDPKKAAQALSTIKITESNIVDTVDFLNAELKRNPISITTETGNVIKAKSLSDIWANKRSMLPKSGITYSAAENTFFGVGRAAGKNGAFTQEQIEKMILNGAIVSEDGKSFWVPQETIDERQLATEKTEFDIMNRQSADQLFNRTKMAANTLAAYKGFAQGKGDTDLDLSPTALTPTRIIGKTLPFNPTTAHFNYQKQIEAVEKELKYEAEHVGQSYNPFGSDEERQEFLKSYTTLEQGNIIHAIAQQIMDNKQLMNHIFAGKMPTNITDIHISKLHEKLNSSPRLKSLWERQKPEDVKEDQGGPGTQIDAYLKILNKYNPNGAIIDKYELLRDLEKQGISLVGSRIRALGAIDEQGRPDFKALKNIRFLSEVGMIGALTESGRGFGRMDESTLSYGRRAVGPTYWQSVAEEASTKGFLTKYLASGKEVKDLSKEQLIEELNKAQPNLPEDQATLEKMQKQLALEDSGKLIWTIGDIKTGRHAGPVTGSQALQTMFYASMANGLRGIIESTLDNSDFEALKTIRDRIRANKGEFTAQDEADLKTLAATFASSKGGRDAWAALSKINNGDSKILQELFNFAGLADKVEILLNKTAPQGGTQITRIDYDRAIQDPLIQEYIARMRANPNAPIFEDQVKQTEFLTRFGLYEELDGSQGVLTAPEIKASRIKAIEAAKKYRSAYAKREALIDKKMEDKITPDEQTELAQLNEEFSKGAYAGSIIDALKLSSGQFDEERSNEIKESFRLMGLNDRNIGELMSTLQGGDFAEFKNTLGKVMDQSGEDTWKQTVRGGEFGLKKWFKAQKENIDFKRSLRDLRIKRTGFEAAGKDTTQIDEDINNYLNAIKYNDQIIDKYKNIYTDKTLGGATDEWKAYQGKLTAYQNKKVQDSVYDKLDALQGLYGQRSSLLAEQARLQEELNNPNVPLTSEQEAAHKLRLNQIKDTLDIEVENYIEAYIKQIQDVLGKKNNLKPEEKSRIQEQLTNIQNAVIGDIPLTDRQKREVNLGALQGVQQRQAAAFNVYNGYNSALYDLERNGVMISKASDPLQRRLLEIERQEIQGILESREAERSNYEATSKEQGTDDQNTLEKEKADILLQQRLAQLTQKPGLIGSAENKVGGLLMGMVKGYGLHRVIMRLIRSVSQLVQQAIGLDKVLANLRIVTGDSKNSTRQLISEYANLGKAIGVTTTEVASSAVEWLRQGYETAEVLDLVKSSMYLSKLGMMDASTATQSLTSALKGFKLQASESMNVVDKLTAIDMKAATSAGEIAQGLAQFANLGSLAGVNIDQAAAYVATISDVTQMSGSSAGQALKTIISRYGNVKAGAYTKLNTDSESSDENVNINDVERVLSKLGISIRKSNLEFKDFDEVLDSIAEKWSTLDRVSQKAVATAFAGIRQQEAFVTLLQNWDKYQDLLEVSENSKGTAEKKMVSYKESYEAAKGSFTAALQDFLNRAEINDLLTQIVKFGTKLVEILPKLIRHLVNIFFSIQNIRSFTGNSIFQKLIRSFTNSEFLGGFKALKANKPGDITGIRALGYYLGGGLKHGFKSIFGADGKPKLTPGQKISRWFGFTPKETAQNATAANAEANTTAATVQTQGNVPIQGMAAPVPTGGVAVGNYALTKAEADRIMDYKLFNMAGLKPETPGSSKLVAGNSTLAYKQLLSAKQNGNYSSITQQDILQYNAAKNNPTSLLQMAQHSVGMNINNPTISEAQLPTIQVGRYGLTENQANYIMDQKAIEAYSMYGQESAQYNNIIKAQQNQDYSSITGRDIKNFNTNSPVTSRYGAISRTPKSGGGGGAARGVMAGVSYGMNQLVAGLTAYQMTGQTHKNASGKEVQSSDYARKTGGSVAAAWTALVPFVGTFIGNHYAQKTMAKIDAVKDSVDEMSEKASKIISAMNEITGSVDTLTDIASSDNFDINKMEDAINSITSTLFTEENKDARDALADHLGGQSIYDVLENYEKGDEKERRLAARRLKLATLQTQNENAEKSREAEIYRSQNSEVSQDNYINYLKNKGKFDDNIDAKTGLTKAAKARTYDVEYHKGSAAAKAAGKAAAGVGTALAFAGTATGPAAIFVEAAAGFLIAAGAITDSVIGTALWAKEQEAAIEAEQKKASDEWQAKGVFGQIEALQAERDQLIKNNDEEISLITDIDKMLKGLNDTASQILNNLKQTNKERTKEAILSTGLIRDEKTGKLRIATQAEKDSGAATFLDELSMGQLKSLGVDEVIKLVASQIETSGGFEGYYTFAGNNVSEYAKSMITQQLTTYDKKFEEFLNGGIYTLSETLAQDRNDSTVKERLKNFANAFGVSVEELDELAKSQGMLKLSEALQSTQDSLQSVEDYGSLMSSITDATKSATQWMSEIVSKYPELIAYMSDTPVLIDKIMNKIGQLIESQFNSQFSELIQQDSFYDILKTQGREEVGYNTLKSGIEALSGEALQNKVWEIVNSAGNLQELWNTTLGLDQQTEEAKALKNIILSIGDEYDLVSDAYREFIQSYAEGQSKELEKQLNNLESQKQALQDINKQREYQNQLIEAQLRLDNALNEKQRVYRAGVGFVYEADQSAIAKAQEDLENVEQNKQISLLEQQTNLLQTLKDQWDNMYAEQTYDLQKKQNKAFEKYLLAGEKGFEGEMNKLADVSAATSGSTKKLSDMLSKQFGTQEEKREAAVNEAADLLLAYENSDNDQNLLQQYQDKLKEAKNLGGTTNQVQASAIQKYSADTSKYANITATTSESGKITGLTGKGKEAEMSAEKVGSQKVAPDKYDVSVYKSGDRWLRTLYWDETDGANILNWVYADSKKTTVGDSSYDAASAGDWGGFYEKSNTGKRLFEVLVPDGGELKRMTLTKWYTGGNDLAKDGTAAFNAFHGLNQNDFYAKIQSSITGDYVILGGLAGDDEYVYVPKKGDPIPLKIAKKSEGNWTNGGTVEISKEQKNSYKTGTLQTPYAKLFTNSLINEVGTEAIITPSGTITALPSHTGIVPADITKNLWSLGELAPALIRVLSPKIIGDHIGVTGGESVVDESFNISTINMNVSADESFDADAFVDSIKTRANLTKNIRRS